MAKKCFTPNATHHLGLQFSIFYFILPAQSVTQSIKLLQHWLYGECLRNQRA